MMSDRCKAAYARGLDDASQGVPYSNNPYFKLFTSVLDDEIAWSLGFNDWHLNNFVTYQKSEANSESVSTVMECWVHMLEEA